MRPRIVPVLQLHRGWLTKTRQFGGNPYLGDAVNAVRIFNELEVDELVLLDVSASRGETALDSQLIASIASEAFMPVAYGGGIQTIEDARSIVRAGIEKLVFNTAVIERPSLISAVAAAVGSQSVVASVDVDGGTGQARIANGRRSSGLDAVEFAQRAVELGAGEVLINSIERDGTRTGYDLDLIAAVSSAVAVPTLALGGADSLVDMRQAIDNGASGACAGSAFVYYGRLQAVLVTYPSQEEIKDLMR